MASKLLLESQSKRIESLLSIATNSMSLVRDPQALKAFLTSERDRLLQEVEKLKTAVVAAEIRNGKRQLFSSFQSTCRSEVVATDTCTPVQPAAPTNPSDSSLAVSAPAAKAAKPPKEKAEKKTKNENKADAAPPAPEVVDVSRLDMRIGLIVEATKHPEADNLYVEKVDVGEGDGKIRTVISGLAKHVPLEEMQKRMCIFLCNLKPAKLKGISSEAMVMCANNDGTVEILKPPAGCKPGDRIVVPGYPGQPDAELNPKKKIWEQVMPDLQTTPDGKAAYKGIPWTVNGENCTCSLGSSQIK